MTFVPSFVIPMNSYFFNVNLSALINLQIQIDYSFLGLLVGQRRNIGVGIAIISIQVGEGQNALPQFLPAKKHPPASA